jgi:hypothetical protein
MSGARIKYAILSLVLALSLPIVACSKDSPTSPTQSGPLVGENVTVSGTIVNLNRSGAGGLNVSFRVDDFTIVHATPGTTVIAGSVTGDTSHLRSGQVVTAEGPRANGILEATRITITSM